MATVRLTDLLPTSGYLLPYALSLFFSSLVLTFAGAFLTLDRTRSFAPVDGTFQDRQKPTSRLIASFIRGGVGGILTGFAFGIHFTTFLSLLIPSVTTSQPLKPASYVTVWLLSSLVTSVAAGRWKCFGFATSGFCGGASIALAVSVAIHPSLLTRVALVAIFASTLAILTPLPIAHIQPILLRTSTSAVGSFGLVLSIALFSDIEPWSNVWEHLWVHDDIQWGSAPEKGLTAGFFLFLVSGIGTDWWLRFKCGENPDQKWDGYLAHYVANLPAESNRAGIFHPITSMWSKPPTSFKDSGLESRTPSDGSREKEVNFLRKGRKYNRTGNGRSLKTKARENIKFRPLDDDDDSTESGTEAGDVFRGGPRHTNLHPRPLGAGSAASTHSLTPTVLEGVHSHIDRGKDMYEDTHPVCLPTGPEVPDPPDYSDHEADITSYVKSARHDPGWTPRFLRNKVQLLKPNTDSPHTGPRQDQVLSGRGRHGLSEKNFQDPPQRDDSPRWQAFWRDVDEKIQHKKFMN